MNRVPESTRVVAPPGVDGGDTVSLDNGATIGLDSGITLSLDAAARTNIDATVADPALTTPSPNPTRVAPGQVRYVILGQAGQGGMATVHVARDLELMRKVALKQLAGELVDTGSARLRFLREVQITAQLDHPHIVPVYGLEVAADGAPAYAMKLVEGRTLADYLQEARDAYVDGARPDEAHDLAARLEHFLKVCDAVDYAHGKGVIHRDLKPANVMIGAHREIYVMDWGICRLFGQDDPEAPSSGALADSTGGNRTEFGSVVGTPRYMSPEQAQGRSDELGPRSDQCALGLMLFELATLRSPHDGDNALAVLEQAAHAKRAPLAHLFESRALPVPLRAIIERATHYEPSSRYASVRDFADDIRRFLRGEAVLALPDTLWQRAQRFVGRHRQGVLMSLFGVIALAACGFAALVWRHEQAQLAAQAREQGIHTLVDEVSQQGDRLQLRLLELRGEVSAMATASALLLQHAEPTADATIYWNDDYRDASRRPPDFSAQPGFARPVSLEWAVWYAAPGVDRVSVVPLAQRLHALHSYRNELFALARDALGGGEYANGVAEVRLVLQQGLAMRYPGRLLDLAEDERLAPWYLAAAAAGGPQWSRPYFNNEGDTVLLPLGEALRDSNGDVLGAFSIDLALDYIVHNLVRDESHEAHHRLLLLDPDGNILASKGRGAALHPGAGVVELEPFGDAALRHALATEEIGAVTTTAFGQPEIVAFDRIHPLGWVLVLVAPDPE